MTAAGDRVGGGGREGGEGGEGAGWNAGRVLWERRAEGMWGRIDSGNCCYLLCFVCGGVFGFALIAARSGRTRGDWSGARLSGSLTNRGDAAAGDWSSALFSCW